LPRSRRWSRPAWPRSPDAGLTAYHAAAKAARKLRPGDKCVMIGAGGLGHIGIQVMTAIGAAELIAVDRNPGAVELATSIGASHGVVADGTEVEHVLELTGGKGARSSGAAGSIPASGPAVRGGSFRSSAP
jgi:D-arabinose 1-dehydrogenase-like Zn-dependent alcohol dehydrogenase